MKFDSSRFVESLSEYFFDIAATCPYGRGHTAIYRQASLGRLPDEVMDLLLASGYRRNGNIIYAMNCQGCESCIPIRLAPHEFRPGRNQRRVLKRNRDVAARVGPLVVDQERLDLCNKFLAGRYPGKASSAEDYYGGFFLNSIVNTVEITYRVEGKLIGVSIVDVTATAMNAVYCYFDPDQGQRSPGTFNILFLLELAGRKGFDLVYLGYWIPDVQAMSYKARFLPHFLFRQGVWEKVTG